MKRRGVIALAILLVAIPGAVLAGYAGPTFYVATTGNDAASGAAGAPFATLARAAQALRDNGLTARTGGAVDAGASVAAGTYLLTAATAPLTLTEWDSGSSAHQAAWTCSGASGSCIVQPSVRLQGCTVYSGSIYLCHTGTSARPNAVWEGGNLLTLARTPNLVVDPSFPTAHAPYYTAASGNTTVLNYTGSALTPSAWNLSLASVFMWVGGTLPNWYTEIVPVTSFDESAHTLTLATPVSIAIAAGMRFFAQGDCSMLDERGEWCNATTAGDILVWPLATPISGEDIEVPVAKTAIRFLGSSDSSPRQRARYITMTGFTVRYADAIGPEPSTNAYGTVQHLVAAIEGTNTDHITIASTHVTQVGNTGIAWHGYNDVPTMDTVMVDHVGRDGIVIDNNTVATATRPSESGDVATNAVVHNFKVEYVGMLDGFGMGIFAWNASAPSFTYGSITHGPRHGTYILSTNGANETSIYATNAAFDHVGVYNQMEDSGDGGCIYSYGLKLGAGSPPAFTPNYYSQMLVDQCFSHPSQHNADPTGSYMDARTYRQSLVNVKITNTGPTGPVCQWVSGGKAEYTITNVLCGGDGTGSATFDNGLMDTTNIGPLAGFPFAMLDVRARARYVLALHLKEIQ